MSLKPFLYGVETCSNLIGADLRREPIEVCKATLAEHPAEGQNGAGQGDDGPAAAALRKQYDADCQAVWRISLFSSSPAGTPWMWSIDFPFHDGRDPAHGFEAKREAAMQAFTRCWFREA
jgi:hypothetical protein